MPHSESPFTAGTNPSHLSSCSVTNFQTRRFCLRLGCTLTEYWQRKDLPGKIHLRADQSCSVSVLSMRIPGQKLLVCLCSTATVTALHLYSPFFRGLRLFISTPCQQKKADRIDRHGQYLRFPRFHHEILQQPDWEPGELIGRIKIVLAEGVLRENTPPSPTAARFDRLRDIVAFSFQHAPQGMSNCQTCENEIG